MSAERCASHRKYKGIQFPKCNGGAPCEACLRKYYETHDDKILLMRYKYEENGAVTYCYPTAPKNKGQK